MKARRQKKCKNCGNEYPPYSTISKVCSTPCAIEYIEIQREAKREKEIRADLKQRKEKLKTKSDWLKEAQPAFNKYIRLRDRDEPCISCGRENIAVEPLTGGKWDCGHFLTIGAHPELRFEESNAYKQCKSCNGGSGKHTRKNYTVGKEYEERLIKKIGQDKVDWLKGPHKPKNYTIEDIKEIKAEYVKKAKELEAL